MNEPLDDFPLLNDEIIEERADKLREEYSAWAEVDKNSLVSVEVIAEQYLGYEIFISDSGMFSDPDCMGGILFENMTITVNAAVTDHEGRYNFTIAHEVGHHVLHRDHYLRNKSGSDEQVICREIGDKPLIERQADRFAAALLMPSQQIKSAFGLLSAGSQPADKPTTKQLRAIAARVVEIGQFNHVSNTAMVNRLIDLGLVSGALYQSGRPQDFYRDARHVGFNGRTLSLVFGSLKYLLKFFRKNRRSK